MYFFVKLNVFKVLIIEEKTQSYYLNCLINYWELNKMSTTKGDLNADNNVISERTSTEKHSPHKNVNNTADLNSDNERYYPLLIHYF